MCELLLLAMKPQYTKQLRVKADVEAEQVLLCCVCG